VTLILLGHVGAYKSLRSSEDDSQYRTSTTCLGTLQCKLKTYIFGQWLVVCRYQFANVNGLEGERPLDVTFEFVVVAQFSINQSHY